jgi:hypothetical protein
MNPAARPASHSHRVRRQMEGPCDVDAVGRPYPPASTEPAAQPWSGVTRTVRIEVECRFGVSTRGGSITSPIRSTGPVLARPDRDRRRLTLARAGGPDAARQARGASAPRLPDRRVLRTPRRLASPVRPAARPPGDRARRAQDGRQPRRLFTRRALPIEDAARAQADVSSRSPTPERLAGHLYRPAWALCNPRTCRRRLDRQGLPTFQLAGMRARCPRDAAVRPSARWRLASPTLSLHAVGVLRACEAPDEYSLWGLASGFESTRRQLAEDMSTCTAGITSSSGVGRIGWCPSPGLALRRSRCRRLR